MRALVIGHDHVAGVEHVGAQLAARGYELRRRQVVPEQLFADPDVARAFPDPAGWDLVVTLGAPWARRRIAGWAGREVAFLAEVHAGAAPCWGSASAPSCWPRRSGRRPCSCPPRSSGTGGASGCSSTPR